MLFGEKETNWKQRRKCLTCARIRRHTSANAGAGAGLGGGGCGASDTRVVFGRFEITQHWHRHRHANGPSHYRNPPLSQVTGFVR